MPEQLRVPSSQGGLVRYFDEYKSKIQIKPEAIVVVVILVIAAAIAMKFLLHVQ